MLGVALGRRLVHAITRVRSRERRWMADLVGGRRHAKVLEIGSGKAVGGDYPYSFSSAFHPSCDVLMTDVEPSFGHPVVDVTAMDFDGAFDVIVCTNVIEHLPEPHLAVERLRRALVPGGMLALSVPMVYPLHDEPGDYWRVTEHGLRHLLRDFSDVTVTHGGMRRAPFHYMVSATAPVAATS